MHKWRSEEAAIMVGTNTALSDDPLLNNRYWSGKDPVRIIIDYDLRLPTSLKIFNNEIKTIIFNNKKSAEKGNLSYIKNENAKSLTGIMKVLFEMNIQSVLVEGGAKLLQSFINDNLWDEARVIRNEQLQIKNGLPAPALENFLTGDTFRLANDLITSYKNSSQD